MQGKEARMGLYRGLMRVAGLAVPDEDDPHATHDAEGRLILRGKAAIVGWFRGHGLMA
jgi:molybdate-binding protein